MDFFKHQDQAKSRSGWIYFLFFLFVGILGVVNGALVYYGAPAIGVEATEDSLFVLSCWAAGITYVVMFGGALIEFLQFSTGGGERVAEMLGGRLVQPTTRDPAERRLLNIVDEMAIASGTPVPKVYILEEEGVNAFAAGTNPSNSVIGVTRGALETFQRDEMQGVIAHEFSHILNGDVRRNVRLAALIFGVFCLYILGSAMIRIIFYTGGSRSRRNNKEGGGLILGIMLAGLVMCAIGLLGQLLGRILQMAHSRQREFLADASAVQFTRNPSGIANALKKLAGRSRIQAARSSSMSHMFFGEVSLSGMLSSHPPLKERIRRIEANWDGRIPETPAAAVAEKQASSRAQSQTAHVGMAGFAGGEQWSEPSAQESLETTSVLPASLAELDSSQKMHVLAGELLTARLSVYALLLAPDADTRKRQEQALADRMDVFEFQEYQRVRDAVLSLPPENHFPLLEMVLPTLEQISEPQFQRLVTEVDEMIAADGRMSKWEFLLRYAVWHHFRRNCGYVSRRKIPSKNIVMPLPVAGGVILRLLVQLSNVEEKLAWQQAVSSLPSAESVVYPADPFPPHWAVLDQAFGTLEKAPDEFKESLLQAGIQVASMDGQLTIEEMELIRLIGMVTGFPIPATMPSL